MSRPILSVLPIALFLPFLLALLHVFVKLAEERSVLVGLRFGYRVPP